MRLCGDMNTIQILHDLSATWRFLGILWPYVIFMTSASVVCRIVGIMVGLVMPMLESGLTKL
jgi:hypothetical protein